MEFRTLGQSGIKVSELAFGAWAIGGMTTIDTTAVYHWQVQEMQPRFSKMLKQPISA